MIKFEFTGDSSMDRRLYDSCVSIIHSELKVALGCTEPIAIAYAAAKARAVLGEHPDKVHVLCSGNIIKTLWALPFRIPEDSKA